jgi:hypothetical protein
MTHTTTRARACRLIAALFVAGASAAMAQKATEMFVPIGQSSGLSGKHTLLGRVQAVNTAEHSITLIQDSTSHTVKLGASVPVWIDRSKQQQSNSPGTLADAKPGMLAEVKFVKNSRSGGEAEWVKLQNVP